MTGSDPHPLAGDTYPSTIAAEVVHEIEVKKSRFVTSLVPVHDAESARTTLETIRKRYWDARHNCHAIIVGPRAESQRSSDDGEPSGTAGVPMLTVLRQRELTDVVAVVSRYFGGILLGAGGLVRAYSGAVAAAVDHAVTIRREPRRLVTVAVDHARAGRFENTLREWASRSPAELIATDYAARASFTLTVPPADVATIQRLAAESGLTGDAVQLGDLVVADVVPGHD